MKAILIDDERQSIMALNAKLELVAPDMDVIGMFQNPTDAIEQIKGLQPDVVFLDIEMPTMNGFQLLEKLRPYNFAVVFVTAYNQYAIRALRASAVDYLLKPIDIDELKNTVETLRSQIKKAPPLRKEFFEQYDSRLNHLFETLKTMSTNQLSEKIALSTQEGVLFILVKDILRVEAMSNYSNFFLMNKQRIIVSRTLKEFEEVLIPYNFFRANRSQLVNLNQITKYQKGDGGVLHLTDGYEVEVSPQRKVELMAKLALKS
jgi:two-component system LytT family response regulator